MSAVRLKLQSGLKKGMAVGLQEELGAASLREQACRAVATDRLLMTPSLSLSLSQNLCTS